MLADDDYPKSTGIKLMAPYTLAVIKVMDEFLHADRVGLDFEITVASATSRILSTYLGRSIV